MVPLAKKKLSIALSLFVLSFLHYMFVPLTLCMDEPVAPKARQLKKGQKSSETIPIQGTTPQAASPQLEIMRITPAETWVDDTQQLLIEFNQAVVPLGRMGRSSNEIAIKISPEINCQWRWISRSALACQLKAQDSLALATRFEVFIPAQFQSGLSQRLQHDVTHTFTTKLPAVSGAYFKEWSDPGKPVFNVYFNQKVSIESVTSSLYFTIDQKTVIPASVSLPPDSNEPDRFFVSPQLGIGPNTNISLAASPGVKSLIGPALGEESRVVSTTRSLPSTPELVGVSCSTIFGKQVWVAPGVKLDESQACDPLQEFSLRFSAPVAKKDLIDSLTFEPPLNVSKEKKDLWEKIWSECWDEGRPDISHEESRNYLVGLPGGLKSNTRYRINSSGFVDAFGRKNENGFSIEFFVGHRKPGFRITSPFAVLEKDIDTDIPIYVTNLNSLTFNHSKLTTLNYSDKGQRVYSPPQVKDVAFAYPLLVRELLQNQSGALVGSFDYSPKLTNPDLESETGKEPAEGEYAEGETGGDITTNRGLLLAQVTPFHVHIKLGFFNSLIWVTKLSDGSPVGDAQVQLLTGRLGDLGSFSPPLAQGQTNTEGLVVLDGINKIDPNTAIVNNRYLYSLLYNQQNPENQSSAPNMLLAKVQSGEDLALVPLVDSFEVDTWSSGSSYISSWLQRYVDHIKIWGMTAQGIYRPGDTIQYKIFARYSDLSRLISPPPGTYRLQVLDPLSNEIFSGDLGSPSLFGGFSGELPVSANAVAGTYNFNVLYTDNANTSSNTFNAFSVLVSDFTPSPFKVTADINGAEFKVGDQLVVTTKAVLHSGGAYGNAPTQVNLQLSPASVEVKDPELAGYSYNLIDQPTPDNPQVPNQQKEIQLNAEGEVSATFDVLESPYAIGVLNVESMVQDERGALYAARASARYRSRDRLVGIKARDWLMEVGKISLVDLVVLDEQGNKVAGVPIETDIERLEVSTARVQGPGNAFIRENKTEWQKVASCSNVSVDQIVSCAFGPDKAGSYRFRARVKDTKGREHQAETYSYASGGGYVLWGEDESTSLELKAEKTSIGIGEKARFFIKNPYPGAKALLSIERGGIIKKWTQVLANSAEVIEVPIEPDYTPGFFFSAVIMSPRVEKPLDAQGVDLGKPAFRMGYATIEVVDRYKEIKVTTKADKEVYRPGDIVNVTLSANTERINGKPLEYTVAVLDEAVFSLLSQGMNAYDPYAGFYGFDYSLDLVNFNIMRNLLGRIKFEKKGANPGGSGGLGEKLRLDFRYVGYWNSSLLAGNDGQASFSFKAPDSLTGWRIIALAATPDDFMGVGSSLFKVNRQTEIRPALPNAVREGDEFQAGFSLFNRTQNPRSLKVTFQSAEPSISLETNKAGSNEPEMVSIDLQPFERKTVKFSVKATKVGSMNFLVRASDELDSDSLLVPLTVRPRLNIETVNDYAVVSSPKYSVPLNLPQDIEPGSAHIEVNISKSIISLLAPAIAYLRDYPYSCWEQRMARTLGAAVFLKLQKSFPSQLKWDDAQAVVRDTLTRLPLSQAPNGGFAYYKPRDEFVSSYLSIHTAFFMEWMQKLGYEVNGKSREKLGSYLNSILTSDANLGLEGTNHGASLLRVLAIRALVSIGYVPPDELTRLASSLPHLPLMGQSAFFTAAHSLSQPQASSAYQFIRNKGIESGGQLVFRDNVDYYSSLFLSSARRDACFVLNELVNLQAEGRKIHKITDDTLTKIARAILRGPADSPNKSARDAWSNSNEASVCALSLWAYSEQLENLGGELEVSASLGNSTMESIKRADPTPQSLDNSPVTFTKKLQDTPSGDNTTLNLVRQKGGAYYANTALSFMPLREDEILGGLELHREFSVEREGTRVLLGKDVKLRQGETVRVDLFFRSPVDRSFVVIEDSLPGAFEVINTELATSARSQDRESSSFPPDSFAETQKTWERSEMCYYCRYGFYHREVKKDVVRFYSEALPGGAYHLSYNAQVIASGTFTLPAVRAEEMYDKDVQYRGESSKVVVE